ncbi:MAG: response regulator [Calditrichaceae bacterium]|nr:response regulator [Calditrichaceae bacterium]MBN2708662.1 response regulator [Calditrichaceae bacterium]RQV96749.1 MAG: response regulator [Calditrichota bacterium]
MKADINTAQKKQILIADDDPDILEQMRFRLEAWGFDVCAVESQKKAEEKIKAGKPALAIYDLMMENQDSGFVLSYLTKKMYPDVPVILITSVTSETGFHFDSSTEETREWIKADAVLDKDIRYEQLESEINRLLKG